MHKVPITENGASNSEYGTSRRRHIYKLLNEFEVRRKKYSRFAVWLVCSSIVFFVGSFFFRGVGEYAVIVGGTGPVIGIMPMFLLRIDFKEKIIPQVMREYGFRYDFGATDMPLDDFLPLLPVFSDWDVSDHIWGRHKSVRVSMAKLKLSMGTPRAKITVFSGLVGYFQFPKTTKSRVVVKSSAGVAGDLTDALVSSNQRVRLEDQEFERRFDVYCDSQVDARYILTPTTMQRLIVLEAIHPGLRVLFQNDEMLIALPNERDLFAVNFFFTPIAPNLIDAFLEDLDQILALVDTLKLDAKTKI